MKTKTPISPDGEAAIVSPLEMSRWQLMKVAVKMMVELFQTRGRSVMYVPRRYDSNAEYIEWRTGVEEIRYEVDGMGFTAFLDVNPEAPPERIWLLFPGNSMLALDWLPVTSYAPTSSDAFLMIDYPGFGESDGKPNKALITSCVDTLMTIVLERFGWDQSEVTKRFQVLGYSLGCAIALDTAARYEIANGILLAPFTTTRDMAATLFNKPISWLAVDLFDNKARLREIAERHPEARFYIAHGTSDSLIPFAMGKELHEHCPENTVFTVVPGAEHNDLLQDLSEALCLALTNGGEFNPVLPSEPRSAVGG